MISNCFVTGQLNIDPKDIANVMFNAIREFKGRHLDTVIIILFQQSLVDSFNSELRKTGGDQGQRLRGKGHRGKS